jgi:hypothetical protein
MKKFIILLIAVMLIEILPVQAQTNEAQLYERKVQTYNRMQKAGWSMTGIGGGLAMVGTVLLITLDDDFWAEEESYYEDESEEMDEVLQAFGGIICLGVGIGLVAGGVTLGSIGSHKARSYQKKLDNLSLGMILTPKRQGLTLTYRF